MTSVVEEEANVHVVGVEGSSDDLTCRWRRAWATPFKARHALGSVNSVNVVRPRPERPLLLRCPPDRPHRCHDGRACRSVRCWRPSGRWLAGAADGLPARLIACTNANDAMHRVLDGAAAEWRPDGTDDFSEHG